MKKFTKKSLLILSALCFAFMLSGCNIGAKTSEKPTEATTQTTTQATTEATTVATTAAPAPSKFVGTWKFTSAKMGSTTVSAAKINMNMSFVFKDDESVSITVDGENETGRWEEENGGVRIFGANEDDDHTLTYENNKLVLEQKENGTTFKMLFEKQ